MRTKKHYLNQTHIISLLILLVAALPLFAQFSGGAGTLASPYQIANARDLNNIRGASLLNKYYIQTADINLSATNPNNVSVWVSGNSYVPGDYVKYTPGAIQYTYLNIQATSSALPTNGAFWVQMWESAKGWQPIGNDTDPFHGFYDGNSKLISNLYINRGASPVANNVYPTDGEDHVGLFGYVSNGSNTQGNNFHTTIRGIGLINPNVTGRRGTGSLVGRVMLPHTLPARSFTVYIERNYATFSAGTAQVRGLGAVGGLVGANNSNATQRVPVVRLSWAYVTVSSTHPNNVARNPNDPTGSGGINNPYNIKYGGLVGCNENGTTSDSFARGNVSGGDRVGGLVGCTIGGAIFRSYSTGTVTQGIVPGDWQGGMGGLVGRVSGTLPPGLGGTVATGSCEDCFWDTQTSGVATSPGGTGRTTVQMKTQATFTNWDFVNVWGIDAGINDGYPYLRGNATVDFYFRTQASGNWSNTAIWQYSSDNSIWNNAVVVPDASNSISILIRSPHIVNVNINKLIDQSTIESGGKLIVNSGVTLSLENGLGTDLAVNGILEVTGVFIPIQNSTMLFGNNSELIYNGSIAQSTGTYFLANVHNLTVNNPAGLTFDNPITVNNVLSVLNGTYSGSTSPDGFYSPAVKYLEIAPSGQLISTFAVSMTTPNLYPQYANRQWNITGTFTGNKQVTFYWTDADDGYFDWTGFIPAVFKGMTKFNGIYDVSGPTRYITVSIPSSLTKGIWTVGRDDEQTLPVQLSSFTATISATNNVTLQWVTQTETNVLGFRIYRGKDDILSNAFMLNTFIPATNTSQTQSYVYHDTEVDDAGVYYYWLQNLDFDGSSGYFGPVMVTLQVGDNPTPQLPLITSLDSAFPNPFNPNTTIRFNLATAGHTGIDIYNARGQKVRTLLNRQMDAGAHRVTWDGRDDSGSPAASGMYFIIMLNGSQRYTQKAVLAK